VKAAHAAGHTLVPFELRLALEAFGRCKPDLVVVPRIPAPALFKALDKHSSAKVIYWSPSDSWARPAADVPLNFAGGKYLPDYAGEAAYCGHYKEHQAPYLDALRKYGVRFRLYGDGPIPECVGRVEDYEVHHIYRTANVSIDLDGDYRRILGAVAAGGSVVSIAHFEPCKVKALDGVLWAHDPDVFATLVKNFVNRDESLIAHTRANDTYHHRLAELLNA
jgi:hypothetical protein